MEGQLYIISRPTLSVSPDTFSDTQIIADKKRIKHKGFSYTLRKRCNILLFKLQLNPRACPEQVILVYYSHFSLSPITPSIIFRFTKPLTAAGSGGLIRLFSFFLSNEPSEQKTRGLTCLSLFMYFFPDFKKFISFTCSFREPVIPIEYFWSHLFPPCYI